MSNCRVDGNLPEELIEFGAKDAGICMNCGQCTVVCPMPEGKHLFPRKMMLYMQMGLREKLLKSPEPWLCYYCGDCSKQCPRGAEPGEAMMAARRYLTAQYDWTGLSRLLYISTAAEVVAVLAVASFVVLLFVLNLTVFGGEIVTTEMSVNKFADVHLVEFADLAMASILTFFLLTNTWRMKNFIMSGEPDLKIPFSLYITTAGTYLWNFATQPRWQQCSDNPVRWRKHLVLMSGYITMLTLIVVFLRWFQVDDNSWHFSALFGYYATATLMYITADMMISRLRKKEEMHKHSHPSDWMFLILLFMTTFTGILLHGLRLANLPMATYIIYVIHLAIAVPMLVIEVPFGKWAHLMYRPMAAFLVRVQERARELQSA